MRKSMNDDCLSLSIHRGSVNSDLVNNNLLMKEFNFTFKKFGFFVVIKMK